MRRSEINGVLAAADAMIHGFALPPFATRSPEEFRARAGDGRPAIDARCGRDVTDCGAGRFGEMGLFLFALRNGPAPRCSRAAACQYYVPLPFRKADTMPSRT